MKSLTHARRGARLVLKEEPNMRIHFVIALLAVFVGLFVGLSVAEWALIAFAITLVFALEVVNSIFERVIDMVKPTVNEYVRDMKDMMAAAVLLAALASVVVGALIFFPKLLLFIG